MARKTKRRPKTPALAPFDRLKRHRDGHEYFKVADGGCKITIRIVVESKEHLQEVLPTAAKFWRLRARWFKAFREHAVEELLPQLNDRFEEDDDKPPLVSATQLRRILKAPFAVDFYRDDDDGSVTFCLSGGEDNALQEYCFEVTANLDEGITDEDLVFVM